MDEKVVEWLFFYRYYGTSYEPERYIDLYIRHYGCPDHKEVWRAEAQALETQKYFMAMWGSLLPESTPAGMDKAIDLSVSGGVSRINPWLVARGLSPLCECHPQPSLPGNPFSPYIDRALWFMDYYFRTHNESIHEWLLRVRSHLRCPHGPIISDILLLSLLADAIPLEISHFNKKLNYYGLEPLCPCDGDSTSRVTRTHTIRRRTTRIRYKLSQGV